MRRNSCGGSRNGPPTHRPTADATITEQVPCLPTLETAAAPDGDPCVDMPLIYERRGDGYLLASVGQNGVYDGGDDMSGDIGGGEWQEQTREVPREKSDLVVRMPVPQRPAPQPPAEPAP